MPLLISPAPGSVPSSDLYKMMVDHLIISADPKNTPYDRYMALENATRLARQYQEGGGKESLPSPLSDPNTVRRQLLAYGQMTLATAAHAINGNLGDSSSQALHLRSAQTIIGLMARAGLQGEDQSYGVFGGRNVFDLRLAQIQAPKKEEKLYAAGSSAPTTPVIKGPSTALDNHIAGLSKQDLSEDELVQFTKRFKAEKSGTESTLKPDSGGGSKVSLGVAGDIAAIYAVIIPAAAPAAPALAAPAGPLVAAALKPLPL